ncbi:MAG: hypothetical protein ACTSR8_20900 [Promethearchaeota archaeon]
MRGFLRRTKRNRILFLVIFSIILFETGILLSSYKELNVINIDVNETKDEYITIHEDFSNQEIKTAINLDFNH